MFGVFLKYIDICDREKQSKFTLIPEVLVWASHYETADFDSYALSIPKRSGSGFRG